MSVGWFIRDALAGPTTGRPLPSLLPETMDSVYAADDEIGIGSAEAEGATAPTAATSPAPAAATAAPANQCLCTFTVPPVDRIFVPTSPVSRHVEPHHLRSDLPD
ncbi:hypothetical protein JCM9534A_13050 [Catenuloplanes indicus JCM 9534]